MIKFDKCCCCIELRTGGIIIGVLGVIGSILQLILSAVAYSNVDNKTDDWKAALAITIIACILGFVSGLCLLLGSIKYRNGLIKVWLIMTVIFCVTSVIGNLITINSGNTAEIIVGVIIQIALTAYFWLCIFSLYQENSGRRT